MRSSAGSRRVPTSTRSHGGASSSRRSRTSRSPSTVCRSSTTRSATPAPALRARRRGGQPDGRDPPVGERRAEGRAQVPEHRVRSGVVGVRAVPGDRHAGGVQRRRTARARWSSPARPGRTPSRCAHTRSSRSTVSGAAETGRDREPDLLPHDRLGPIDPIGRAHGLARNSGSRHRGHGRSSSTDRSACGSTWTLGPPRVELCLHHVAGVKEGDPASDQGMSRVNRPAGCPDGTGEVRTGVIRGLMPPGRRWSPGGTLTGETRWTLGTCRRSPPTGRVDSSRPPSRPEAAEPASAALLHGAGFARPHAASGTAARLQRLACNARQAVVGLCGSSRRRRSPRSSSCSVRLLTDRLRRRAPGQGVRKRSSRIEIRLL